MSCFIVALGQTIKDQISAFEDDGVSKRSGLTVGGGDFSITVWKDCVVDALSVTITIVTGSPATMYTSHREHDIKCIVIG